MISNKDNKHKKINYKLFIEKKIVFLIGSNLSFYLMTCFIKKFKILDYKIIFFGQGGDKRKPFEDLETLLNICKINKKNCLIIDHQYSYKYFRMFINRNKLQSKIKKLIGKGKYLYVTSYNYGLINSLLLRILNLKDNYYIIDDGITHWVNVKNRYNYLKTLLYTIVLRNLIYIPKIRKSNNTQITSLPNISKNKNKNFIDISSEYKNFITDLSKSNKLNIQKNFNVMILCAKNFYYKKGIYNFLIYLRNKLINDTKNPFNEKNTTFFFKLHPGYENDKDLKHLNLINVSNDSIPIEFYDLNNIDLILSPINTSIMYLFHYSLISKKKIYFYNIAQTEYKEKLSIAKSLDIKEFDLSNYKF